VPDAILGKPGKLTPDEWDVMRRHPTIGYRMLEHIGFLRGALPVVLHHHERFDGRGYPDGLAGAAIPLGARIFAVADTFDAMMSDRPYHQACSFAEARAEIERCAGSQFDPEVVAAFLRVDWQSQTGVEPGADAPADRIAAVAATG
jgi:HD-GYP domain-containing protein (c-di-GMP phosphodiesterase class II)